MENLYDRGKHVPGCTDFDPDAEIQVAGYREQIKKGPVACIRSGGQIRVYGPRFSAHIDHFGLGPSRSQFCLAQGRRRVKGVPVCTYFSLDAENLGRRVPRAMAVQEGFKTPYPVSLPKATLR